MRKIINRLIRLYLRPLELDFRLAIFAKGKLLQHKEEHILSFIHMVKRKGDDNTGKLILDVGTFEGNTLRLFGKHLPETQIIGFEPNPQMHSISTANTGQFANIRVENIALGDKEGEMEFFVSDNLCASSLKTFNDNDEFTLKETLKVQTTALDKFVPADSKVLCIKLDIQGFELDALRAGIETLKRTDYVVIEMNNHEKYENCPQYFDIDQFLREQGFGLNNIFAGYNFEGLKEYDAIYERLA